MCACVLYNNGREKLSKATVWFCTLSIPTKVWRRLIHFWFYNPKLPTYIQFHASYKVRGSACITTSVAKNMRMEVERHLYEQIMALWCKILKIRGTEHMLGSILFKTDRNCIFFVPYFIVTHSDLITRINTCAHTRTHAHIHTHIKTL